MKNEYEILACRVINLIIAGLDKESAIVAIINTCSSSHEIDKNKLESNYLLKLFDKNR